jgi:hypothetical protein
MASSWTLDDINRALDLIAAPMVLEVLDGLGHGKTAYEVAPAGTEPEVIAAAIEHLRGLGAVTTARSDSGDDHVALTAYGRRVFDAFERIDANGKISGTKQA